MLYHGKLTERHDGQLLITQWPHFDACPPSNERTDLERD